MYFKGIYTLIPIFILNGYVLLSQGTYTGTGSVTKGSATQTTVNLFPGCAGSRISAVGTITSTDGKVWTVPNNTAYSTGTKLTDLYNECSGVKPASLSAVNLANVPIKVIDNAGEVITGYLLGDNYFELYINGVLVGVDPIPFTPFNSSVVRFKVSRPYTIAVKLVDWEENLGLGTELNGGNAYHSGDGGFIAQFSDGTVTDTSWRAQTFYIAPIENLSTVIEKADGTRSSATAKTTTTCEKNCYGIHYSIPSNWNSKEYNDKVWPNASLYSAATVGVNWPAYTNVSTAWNKAQFIWSSNLILDNVVLVRKTVGATTPIKEIESAGNVFVQNPFSDNISFQCDISLSNVRIDLIDLNGKLLGNWKIPYLSAKDLWQVQAPINLPNGTYLLTIKSTEKSFSRKLIH
jgi:hypothetical protein